MSVASLGQIIYNGATFYYDTFNKKSYVGEPSTNVLAYPQLNGYPTFGNYWGTFNINQYGSGTYFSIGTITDVTSNVITCAGHPLRSYDVVTPQSTGGGVINGSNYLVKKLDANRFTLHPYNDSQDGSQGYINPGTGNFKVYDDWSNDVRISLNISGLSNMWWGQPHLPNSALVKEIIPNGFNLDPNKPTDCIRLHYIRSDAYDDGMAYGADAPVNIGDTYTVSFWTRAVNANAVGQNIGYSIYNYGGVDGATGFWMSKSLGALGVWERHELTFVPDHTMCVSYWFVGGGPCAYDIANIQFEKNSHATPFTVGTRSVTQGLLDLTKNYTIDLTNVSYDSNASPIFNGSSNYIPEYSIPDSFWNAASWSVSVWVKFTSVSRGVDNAIIGHGYTAEDCGIHLTERSSRVYFGFFGDDLGGILPLYAGQWYNIAFVYNRGTGLKTIYLNGAYDNSANQGTYSGTGTNTELGRYPWAPTILMYGSIAVVELYNRVLSATEVLQNFNIHKSRYGY